MPPKGPKNAIFLSILTWMFGLDLETRPCEGPNTSSLRNWSKSIQRFPRYFIHKQKEVTDSNKNTTLRHSLCAV